MAFNYEPEGRVFESPRAHQHSEPKQAPPMERNRGDRWPLTAMCSAMIFQGAPDIFVGGANLLGFVQGIQKFRPILRPAQGRRCFDKFIQCRVVQLP